MRESTMYNHGLCEIVGWPPELDFGAITKKSMKYSQESKETTTSSSTPAGVILDRSANSKIVGVLVQIQKLQLIHGYSGHHIYNNPLIY